MNNKTKLLFRYLEMFLASILILTYTLLIISRLTLLNKNYVLHNISKNHYEEITIKLKEEMKNSMLSSGIDTKVIDDMFTKKDIEDTTKIVIDIIYVDSSKKIDTTKLEDKLKDNIKKYLEENGLYVEDESTLNKFVEDTVQIYKNEFIMLNQISKLGKVVGLLIKISNILLVVMSIILVIYIIIRRKKIIDIIPVALFTSSFVIIFMISYFYYRSGFINFTIFSVTFSKLIRSLVANTFNISIIVAILYLVIGIILIVLNNKNIKRIKKDEVVIRIIED